MRGCEYSCSFPQMVVSKNKEFLFTNSLMIILGFYYNSLVVSSHSTKSYDYEVPTTKNLQTEMALFENTNRRGDNLEKLNLVLRNISPTSVYCEQAFSIATSFITKLRSRLCDQSLDDLQFVKGYFAKESYYK